LLGLFSDVSLEEARTVLRVGESIALFTDGVTELSVERPEEGERLLRSTLRAAASQAAAGIVKTLERSLIEPRGELRDDAALVVAKRLPPEPDAEAPDGDSRERSWVTPLQAAR
jgi:serine phosphatase RsbU (regulator of sigma subunit)